jgi:hypothetical protein
LSPACGGKICDPLKLARSAEVGGLLFECPKGWAPLGATIASGRQGAVSRACCADRSLWKLLLAISVRDDLPPKLVSYGSPERRHSAGAFH